MIHAPMIWKCLTTSMYFDIRKCPGTEVRYRKVKPSSFKDQNMWLGLFHDFPALTMLWTTRGRTNILLITELPYDLFIFVTVSCDIDHLNYGLKLCFPGSTHPILCYSECSSTWLYTRPWGSQDKKKGDLISLELYSTKVMAINK